MSTETGRIYEEVVEFGTDTKPHFRCVHCGRWVLLERANFHGWQDARDVEEARARAAYVCPECGKAWSEEDRLETLKSPVLVSKGQTVDEKGGVLGDPPRTRTFGFRWNSVASAMRTMADVAEKEFRAAQSGRDEELRGVYQFEWALPYSGQLVDVAELQASMVLEKIVGHKRGEIPEKTVRLTLGVDVGTYVVWWALVGWRPDASGHVVDFGSIDVPNAEVGHSSLAVLAALRAFRDDTVKPGWCGRRPDLVLVDSGFEQEVVYRFVLESGQGRYFASKGFGSTTKHGGFRGVKASNVSTQAGTHWQAALQSAGVSLIEIDTDYWKGAVHDGFAAARGAPGSLTLFDEPGSERAMKIFARQILAERRIVDPAPNKEMRYKWVVHSRQNHYLDACTMNRVAADMLGIRLVAIASPPAPSAPAPEVRREGAARIRTRYS